MIDDLARNVRQIVRTVMAMPENSVRPADQHAPAGGQTTEYATVKIIDCQDAGIPGPGYEADEDDDTIVNENIDSDKVFVASVNFYRRPPAGKDAVGAAKYGNAAFERAALLGQKLRRSGNAVLLQTLGLGLLTVSPARNLDALAGPTWESRGQIDLTFTAVSRDSAPVDTVAIIPIGITIQTPDDVLHTITEEVTP